MFYKLRRESWRLNMHSVKDTGHLRSYMIYLSHRESIWLCYTPIGTHVHTRTHTHSLLEEFTWSNYYIVFISASYNSLEYLCTSVVPSTYLNPTHLSKPGSKGTCSMQTSLETPALNGALTPSASYSGDSQIV